jgi:serine/threonine-protein kinase SRPK3
MLIKTHSLACYFVTKQIASPRTLITTINKFCTLQQSRRAMATSGPIYEYINDVERLDGYRSGGYYPIQLSEKLQGRYTITEKLGYGSYSTIWLARDKKLSRYVAIKIGTADHRSKEVPILEQLSASPTNDLSDKLTAPVLDSFELRGPNGIHSCLVTAPARCSLAQALQDYDLLPLDAARSLAAQLVMAVARVHRLRIVHGGLSHLSVSLNRSLTFPRYTSRQPATSNAW